MRKWKCDSIYFTIPAILLFLTQVAPAIFGYKIYHKYRGWEELSLYEGIFLTLVCVVIYIFGKYICISPKVYKCLKCGDVFCEAKVIDRVCPFCKEDLVDIKKYYKNNTMNKNPKIKPEDEITEMIKKRWDM